MVEGVWNNSSMPWPKAPSQPPHTGFFTMRNQQSGHKQQIAVTHKPQDSKMCTKLARKSKAKLKPFLTKLPQNQMPGNTLSTKEHQRQTNTGKRIGAKFNSLQVQTLFASVRGEAFTIKSAHGSNLHLLARTFNWLLPKDDLKSLSCYNDTYSIYLYKPYSWHLTSIVGRFSACCSTCREPVTGIQYNEGK